MEYTELMLNDKVMFNGSIVTVAEIAILDGGRFLIGVNRGFGNFRVGKIESIILTAEILEKNGFKQEYDGYVWNDGINCNEQVYVFCGVRKNGNVNRLEIKNHSTSFYDCFQELSVDRFQRILRICGLTEFADNLKILLL